MRSRLIRFCHGNPAAANCNRETEYVPQEPLRPRRRLDDHRHLQQHGRHHDCRQQQCGPDRLMNASPCLAVTSPPRTIRPATRIVRLFLAKVSNMSDPSDKYPGLPRPRPRPEDTHLSPLCAGLFGVRRQSASATAAALAACLRRRRSLSENWGGR